MRPLWLAAAGALLLAVAGCGLGSDNSPQGQCERQSYDDPTVRRLMVLRESTSSLSVDLAGPYEAARRDALQRCLAGRGLAPPGGVERVAKPYN